MRSRSTIEQRARAAARRVPGASPALRRARRELRSRLLGSADLEELAPEAQISLAYRTVLRRPADRGAFDRFAGPLRTGELSFDAMVDELRGYDEHRVRTPFLPESLGPSLHRSRCEWVLGLPPARRIVDLGGSHSSDPNGALVLMGYPYDFEALTIVDLPPQDRHDIYATRRYQDTVSWRGPIHYEFRSMGDLGFAADGSVDLVCSGQSIEHVTVDEADRVLEEARRVLRPGGHLALDTPNARVCRLQQPQLIDPDHRHEYELGELVGKLRRAGFEVERTCGLNLASRSVASGSFDPAEVAANSGVFWAAEDCYLLAVVARSPG